MSLSICALKMEFRLMMGYHIKVILNTVEERHVGAAKKQKPWMSRHEKLVLQ